MKSRRGFTLIELLVVVAIISVLVALRLSSMILRTGAMRGGVWWGMVRFGGNVEDVSGRLQQVAGVCGFVFQGIDAATSGGGAAGSEIDGQTEFRVQEGVKCDHGAGV